MYKKNRIKIKTMRFHSLPSRVETLSLAGIVNYFIKTRTNRLTIKQ